MELTDQFFICDNEDYNDPNIEFYAYVDLWITVIVQAIDDSSKIIDPTRKDMRDLLRFKKSAKYWLFKSNVYGIGSLAWICNYIGLDIEWVRRIARIKIDASGENNE